MIGTIVIAKNNKQQRELPRYVAMCVATSGLFMLTYLFLPRINIKAIKPITNAATNIASLFGSM